MSAKRSTNKSGGGSASPPGSLPGNSGSTRNEEIFRSIFESANVGKSITSLKGEINVNQAFCDMLGYTREELQHKTWKELTPREEHKPIQEKLDALLGGQVPSVRFQKRYIHKNGSHVWADVSVALMKDRHDRPLNFITTVVDISQQKLTEEELRNNEEWLGISIEMAGIAVWEYDFEENVLYSSKNYSSLYGMEWQKRWNHQDFMKVVHEADRECVEKRILDSIAPGGRDNSRFDFRVLYPDDSIHWLHMTARVVKRDEEGRGLLVRGSMLDIDDRKLAESELEASEERYRSFFENSMDAILITGPKGGIVAANSAACKMFGHSEEEILGLDRDGIADLKDPRLPALWKRRAETGSTYGELTLLRKDGTTFEAELTSSVFSDSSGNQLTTMIIRDITDRKRAEAALKQSEEKFHKAFHNTPDAITITRASDGLLLDVNEAMLRMSGYSRKEVIGNSSVLMGLWHDPEDRNRYVSILREKGNVRDFGTRFFTRNGEVRDFSLSAELFVLNNETCILGVLRDVTEQKRAQLEIEALHRDLEKRVEERTAQLEMANKDLESFTFSVSHDLKAPLRGISGFAQLLRESLYKGLEKNEKGYLDNILSAARNMDALIEDLLKYSHLERATMLLARIRIRTLLESILDSYEWEMQSGGFRMVMDVPETEVVTDPQGISIAIRNLLENAIKFSREEEDPVIEIRMEEQDSCWILSVSDNGIGFDMQHHSRIYEIFQRLNSGVDYAGTGIGLAMVRKVMQRMNGKVWAESIPGKGSTFFLEMPKADSHDI